MDNGHSNKFNYIWLITFIMTVFDTVIRGSWLLFHEVFYKLLVSLSIGLISIDHSV